jgi:hypothetical protein
MSKLTKLEFNDYVSFQDSNQIIKDIDFPVYNVECYIKDKDNQEKFIYLGYLYYEKKRDEYNIYAYNHYVGSKNYILSLYLDYDKK